jgi:hypothetical protein
MWKALQGQADPPAHDVLRESDPSALRPLSETNPLRGKIAGAHRDADPALPCAFPIHPPCREQPIASHSIQRGGPLAFLANEQGKVVVFQPRLSFDKNASSKSIVFRIAAGLFVPVVAIAAPFAFLADRCTVPSGPL